MYLLSVVHYTGTLYVYSVADYCLSNLLSTPSVAMIISWSSIFYYSSHKLWNVWYYYWPKMHLRNVIGQLQCLSLLHQQKPSDYCPYLLKVLFNAEMSNSLSTPYFIMSCNALTSAFNFLGLCCEWIWTDRQTTVINI